MDLKLPKNVCAGLDIGKSSTKFVVLRMVKGRVELVKHAIFHAREEGLVDEEEVVEHVRGWMREMGMDDVETRVGLPQYMAISQVSDFPETEDAQLDDMVQYEIRQLGGLTDEEFIHDYVRLKPFDNYRNPVFLAECRESVIENRLGRLASADLCIEAVHMEGQGLADAYLQQQPEEDKDKLVMLLDVGGENTTLALIRDGQLVYLGSFLFGGEFFNDALAKRYGVSAADAERMKFDGSLSMNGEADNPLLEQARTFILELEAALDNAPFYNMLANEPPIHAIYLSGGGGKLKEFDTFISDHYGCPVRPLSVPTLDGDDNGFFAIAYGLALQGVLPKARQSLSLTPEEIEFTALRRKRRVLPVLTLGLFILTCIGYIGLRYWLSGKRCQALEQKSVRLGECVKLADPIQENSKMIQHYQQMLKPFVARGNRNAKLVRALHELSKTRKPGCWFYFVSDPQSFFDREDDLKTISDPSSSEGPRPGLFSGRTTLKNQSSDRQCYLASSVVPWEGLVFAGFVPMNEKDRLKLVRDMRSQLEGTELFDRVDTMAEVTQVESFSRKMWEDFGMFPFRFGCRFSDIEFKVDRWEGVKKK